MSFPVKADPIYANCAPISRRFQNIVEAGIYNVTNLIAKAILSIELTSILTY